MSDHVCDLPDCDGKPWDLLAAELIKRDLGDGKDVAQRNDNYGEVWQFLGIADGNYEFRHRAHPKNDQRVYLHIPVAA